MDNRFSQHSLCSKSSKDFGYFYTFANVSTLSGFCFTLIVLIGRIIRIRSGNEKVPYFIAFNVASMSLITAILDTIFEQSGICIDSLG